MDVRFFDPDSTNEKAAYSFSESNLTSQQQQAFEGEPSQYNRPTSTHRDRFLLRSPRRGGHDGGEEKQRTDERVLEVELDHQDTFGGPEEEHAPAGADGQAGSEQGQQVQHVLTSSVFYYMREANKQISMCGDLSISLIVK